MDIGRMAEVHARSLLLTGPGRLEWREDDLPLPGAGEVLVETLAGAISIGTELALYRGTARIAQPHAYPFMTGYEGVGRVLATGAGVTRPRAGERIFGFWGHRSHAVISAAKAVAAPAWADDALALLGILSCDVARGVRKLDPHPDEPVLVTGCGTIGLLAVWTLAARGVRAVDALDPLPTRRELALALGARRAADPASAPAGEYAAGIECSSRDAAFGLLQQCMRHGGRICILADGNLEPLTLSPHFHARELSVVGSSDGDDYHAHAAWFFERARCDAGQLARLFDLHINAADLPATFARMAAGEIAPVKVLVRWPAGGYQ